MNDFAGREGRGQRRRAMPSEFRVFLFLATNLTFFSFSKNKHFSLPFSLQNMRTSTVVLTTIPDGRTATASVAVTAAWVVNSMFFGGRGGPKHPKTIRGIAFSVGASVVYHSTIQDSGNTQSIRAVQASLMPANPDTLILGNGYPQGSTFNANW